MAVRTSPMTARTHRAGRSRGRVSCGPEEDEEQPDADGSSPVVTACLGSTLCVLANRLIVFVWRRSDSDSPPVGSTRANRQGRLSSVKHSDTQRQIVVVERKVTATGNRVRGGAEVQAAAGGRKESDCHGGSSAARVATLTGLVKTETPQTTSRPLHLYTSRPLDLYTFRPLPLYTSTPLDLYTSRPLHLYTSTPLHLYTFSPLDLQTSRPLHLYTSTHLLLCTSRPLDLFTSTPLHLYTSTPLDLFTSTPLHLYTSTPLDLYTSRPLHLYTSTPLHL
ncbi:unnamed protein product [Pleuronectes platessa]|uniref:Uncharacterized protein n=1 Tax=Pleuronectes platessa TaxID=8262 RepID=A0A9N7UDN9_PLEPL|nr:unnamed protein product [Pleuronectes platessa]